MDSPTQVVPFGWEPDPADAQNHDERETVFRFPAADDPAPGTTRLLIMALSASALGLAGIGVGVRGLVSSIGGGVPAWYIPTLILAALLSVALAVAAFLSIHRKALPYALMALAALPLAGAVFLSAAY